MNRLASILMLVCWQSFGASHCVYVGATGTGSGDTWTDAYTALPASLVRGDIYYIADGNYAGGTWNTANSGTTLCIIKKAISSDHSTDTGWISTMGDGQAVFTNAITIATDYWYIDGQAGEYPNTAYGIKVSTAVIGAPTGIGIHFYNGVANSGVGGIGSTIRYVEIAGPNTTSGEFNFTSETTGCTSWSGANPITISHCYIHGFTTGFDSVSNWTIEYCHLRDFRSSNAGTHENVYYCGYGTTNVSFRFNHAANYDAEGVFLTYYNGCPRDIRIYGNTFTSGGDNAKGITFRADGNFTNIYVYNNSFGPLTGLAIYNQTGESANYTTNCYVTNNLSYGSSFSFGDLLAGTNVTSVANPFINLSTGNFRLTQAIPGISLSAQYNTDPDGNTRGADGVWDVGAYEYSSLAHGKVTIPGKLTVIGKVTL